MPSGLVFSLKYAFFADTSGRMATEEEVAAELEISLEELDAWQAQTKVAGLVSYAFFADM